MRKLILTAVAVASLAVPALAPALASADVQAKTATLTSTVDNNGNFYVHTYNITIAPNGSFTGTGGVENLGINETISGTINGSTVVSFTANYLNGGEPGYWWSSNGTDIDGRQFTVTNDLTILTYKNHGDYVSSQGGGADAAHSSIGMPTNSSK
jgi:hypothetical protein